jgi:hypothetical protein
MSNKRLNMLPSAVLLTAAFCAATSQAQQNATWREWNQPIPPFRIAGQKERSFLDPDGYQAGLAKAEQPFRQQLEQQRPGAGQ